MEQKALWVIDEFREGKRGSLHGHNNGRTDSAVGERVTRKEKRMKGMVKEEGKMKMRGGRGERRNKEEGGVLRGGMNTST